MFSSSSHPHPAPSPLPYPFQTYILPTQPFRRRRSSATPSASPSELHQALSPSQESLSSPSYTNSSYSSYSSSYSRQPQQRPRRSSYLQNHTSHISCARCKASLALSSQIISKGFTGRHGRALLVSPSSLDTAAVPSGSSPSAYSYKRQQDGGTMSTGSGSRDTGMSGESTSQDQGNRVTPPPTRRRSSALSNAFSAALSLASSPFSPTSTTPQSSISSSATVSGSWLSRSLSSTTTSPSSPSTSPPYLFTTSSPTSSSTRPKPPLPPTTLPNTRTHTPVPRHLVTGLHIVADVSCTVCSSVLGWKYISTEEEAQRYKVRKYILECGRVVGGSEWDGGYGIGEGGTEGVFGFEEEEGEDGEEGQGEEGGDGEDGDGEVGEAENREQEQEGRQTDDGVSASASVSTSARRSTRIRWNDEHTQHTTSHHEDNHHKDYPYPYPYSSSSPDDDEVLFDSQDEDECDDLFAGMWSPQVARLRRDSKRRDSPRLIR